MIVKDYAFLTKNLHRYFLSKITLWFKRFQPSLILNFFCLLAVVIHFHE